MTYTWHRATLHDVDDIVKLAEQHFQKDIASVFTPNPPVYARNLVYTIVNQTYYPDTALLAVARQNDTGKLLAYTWAKAGDKPAWSDDNILRVMMAHVDLTLSTRFRVTLIRDMLRHWEEMARRSNNNVICSTTMRDDQTGFLKLHLRAGYKIVGNAAYKRIS